MNRKDKRVILQNRRARHEYAISDTLEAGLVLVGTEVKSLRAGHGHLTDAFITVDDGEAWLRQAFVPEYTYGNRFNHDPVRPRKLLYIALEIERLKTRIREKGFTAVPLKLYFSGARVKTRIRAWKRKETT